MTAAVVAIVVGITLAVVIASRFARAEARSLGHEDPRRNADGLAAGILREIAMTGGASAEAAREIAQARTGWSSLPDERIDVATWGEAFAAARGSEQRAELLEAAVVVAMSTGLRIPAAQYSALMALSFSLGFHSDALARLRERYRFEFDDWARLGRPRDADRSGGGAPLFDREAGPPVKDLLAVLGLDERTATRQSIVSAYRHLAAETHPDRYHDATGDERATAAERFRELSGAYQSLMQVWHRD